MEKETGKGKGKLKRKGKRNHILLCPHLPGAGGCRSDPKGSRGKLSPVSIPREALWECKSHPGVLPQPPEPPCPGSCCPLLPGNSCSSREGEREREKERERTQLRPEQNRAPGGLCTPKKDALDPRIRMLWDPRSRCFGIHGQDDLGSMVRMIWIPRQGCFGIPG